MSDLPNANANGNGNGNGNAERTWFITGCSSGFGRAFGSAVLERGERLVATARDPDALSPLVEQGGDRVAALALDVTDREAIPDVVASARERFGRIDVLVNNAGRGLVAPVEGSRDEDMRMIFETNVFGPIRLMRAVLPIMRDQGRGHVVNMSAIAAFGNDNDMGFGLYGGSKSALEGVSEALAKEAKPLGIRVTIVEPGPFRTDFIRRSLARSETRIDAYDATCGKFEAQLDRIEGKQAGDPDQAARAIMRVVDSERPPLRLVLGKYAVEKARRKLETLGQELDAWDEVGAETNFH